MDNQELKIKFDEVQKKIETAKANKQDVKSLLKEKYDLLKIGFARIKRETSSEEFDKNPKKYSTLLSYVNTMKETAKEAEISLSESETLEKDVIEEMKKNNLDWLLNK